MAERIIVPYFAREAPSIKLDEITPSVLRAFIEYLASQGYAPATVRRYYAPLRAMLATAYEDDLIARNPASGVRVVVTATQEVKPKRLTPEETRLLLSKFPAEHADLAYVMAATGLRIAEVLNLCWSDFATGKDGPTLTVCMSKTPAGRRTIPVTSPTASRLTKLRTAAQAANDQPIFPSARGTHLDPNNFRRTVFRPAAKAAGLEWATPHTLRHGMASLMADNGCSAAHIASYLGHADGGVLAQRTYIHPTMVKPDFIDDALGC